MFKEVDDLICCLRKVTTGPISNLRKVLLAANIETVPWLEQESLEVVPIQINLTIKDNIDLV